MAAECETGLRSTSGTTTAGVGDETFTPEHARHERDRAQQYLDIVGVVIVALDKEGTVTLINRKGCEILRCPQDQILGKNWFDHFLPQRVRSRVREVFQQIMQGSIADVEFFENPVLARDGQERIIQWHNAEIRDSRDTTIGTLSSGTDITERKRAEEALRESEERIGAILKTAADAIITIDERGTIESFNPAAEKMFGYRADEAIGQNLKLLMPAPYRDEHDGYLSRYLQTGQARIIDIGRELMGRRKDGSTFPMDLAVSELPEGTQRFFTGIIRDISERKELQSEILRVIKAEQTRLGQELHDNVQQQLTGLGLMAQNLADGLAGLRKGETAMACVGELLQTAARIAEGIRETLEDTRLLARGLVPVEIDAHGLMSALSELAAQTRRLKLPGSAAEHQPVRVNCTVRCAQPVDVADNFVATHLYRIAQEAVTNALKHGRADRIQISLAETPGALTLAIRDNGIGIDPKRAGASGDRSVSRGMGLRIMGYRAGLIGATLNVGQVAPQGTLVTCTLTGHWAGKSTSTGGDGASLPPRAAGLASW
jgi:PAS domain S-box-containing protein